MSPKKQTINISMTLVYIAQQSKAVIPDTQEAVNLDLELGLDNPSTFYASAWALKMWC